MGRRSRKSGRVAGGSSRPPREPRVRGEARDAQIRATLTPLAPGERPRPVTVAAVVAGVIAVGNVALYAAGVHIRHAKAPTAGGILVLSALMAGCSYGLWRSRYWAVLGFEALLALTVIFAALSLTVASTVRGAAISLAIVLLGGWLFYRLVRIMARIQMPERARR